MRWWSCLALVAVWSAFAPVSRAAEPLPALKISENRRFIVTEKGQPFFYLGDTAWELFHRLTLAEAGQYFRTRAAQGFTVIQAVVIAEEDGLHVPNALGETPLLQDNPTRPNEKYFQHVDAIVKLANDNGLRIGMLPSWGDKWNQKWGVGPEVFNPENARKYGEFLGKRYRDSGVIWILGGDRPIENETHRKIITAMAEGLKAGDGGRHLITFHPPGGNGSSTWFHDAPWLDFNMRQNGHNIEYTGRYDKTRQDYDRTPVKPVLDGEPVYEGHPVAFKAKELGHTTAADVRRPLYWDLFSGACGHTYGHHSIWQFYTPQRKAVNNPIVTWEVAVKHPGAEQMRHGRSLIESRPVLSRIPDDGLLIADAVATHVPGAGTRRFVATRDSNGSYAFIYVPWGTPFRVSTEKLTGKTLQPWWYDPRTGQSEKLPSFENTGKREFTPPSPGELLDWVLVIDDASENFPPPGQVGKR